MSKFAKIILGSTAILAVLATGNATAQDRYNEIGLIVGGVIESWNGVQIIDGGGAGDDTTLASGYNARLSLPLGGNLSLQSDVDVEWNDRTFDNNAVSGQRWSFQGAGHISWRGPLSHGLFRVFGGVAASRHNDTVPGFKTNLRFVGAESQFYLNDLTFYAQGAFVGQQGELTGDGFFARGVGRWFMAVDSRVQVEGLYSNLRFQDGASADYDVYEWGARYDTLWEDAPLLGSMPLFLAYRGTYRIGCLDNQFATAADNDTMDHTIMAGLSYNWGAPSKMGPDPSLSSYSTDDTCSRQPRSHSLACCSRCFDRPV